MIDYTNDQSTHQAILKSGQNSNQKFLILFKKQYESL